MECREIVDKICSVYGQNEMWLTSVICRFNKFECQLTLTEDVSPMFVGLTKMTAKVIEIVHTDAKYTTRQIARILGILLTLILSEPKEIRLC